MKISNFLIPVLGAIVAGALVRYYWPRIETKTIVETVTKNRTITRIVKRPNGVTVTEIDSTTSATKSSIKLTHKAPQWRVGLLATMPTDGSNKATRPGRYMPQYGIEVQKRLVGPLYAGILYVHPYIGAQIGLEF